LAVVGVDLVVRCRGCGEWGRFGDGDGEVSVVGDGGEVAGGRGLGGGGEVVAAEEADGDVVKQHGPEVDSGLGVAGGVGGDHRSVGGHGGVEGDVVGEGDLDDPVDAVGCVVPDRLLDVRIFEGDGTVNGPAGQVGEVGAAADGGDDGSPYTALSTNGGLADQLAPLPSTPKECSSPRA